MADLSGIELSGDGDRDSDGPPTKDETWQGIKGA